ncbi:hypothetical protein BLNAU_14809 [Blattamonas nauphoetae]|uniref:Uncharacterized protein n=1 Tax=Blattamonas nauphoetae TaxID=2049346 RepID=A0ABQ9XFP1_9EUKA|nr:hypothetical protein BLNAU_14809 [Blattamonas nauphoetae]
MHQTNVKKSGAIVSERITHHHFWLLDDRTKPVFDDQTQTLMIKDLWIDFTRRKAWQRCCCNLYSIFDEIDQFPSKVQACEEGITKTEQTGFWDVWRKTS